MNTPICDFVSNYIKVNKERAHMPGHKGYELLGPEKYDITEIDGADSLYEASGIIQMSENNASELFGCTTFYSCEGSSLAIRAMLYLVCLHAKDCGKQPKILAVSNVHKVFLSAAALLDFSVDWIEQKSCYLDGRIDAFELDKCFKSIKTLPTALYITSPDYLGNMCDIGAISKVCRKYGVLLAVDSAHGAYLRFLESSGHPIDLGADICCSSAHKTLPALTGGAYLHISSSAPKMFSCCAKDALSLFGSTSPSYLILQSLDMTNVYLSEYRKKLSAFVERIEMLKQSLFENGYTLLGDEPLKLTIYAKDYGYTGYDLADGLRQRGVECEFSDPDYVVLMLSPELNLNIIKKALCDVKKREKIEPRNLPKINRDIRLTPRQALMLPFEEISVKDAAGRILASASVGCPPAVPVAMAGQLIDKSVIEYFNYYGVEHINVIKRK